MAQDDNMAGMNHDMGHMDHMKMDHDTGDMAGMDHMHHMGNFKQKFWVSLVAAIPVFVLSPFMGLHLPFQFTFPGSDWVVLILASFLFFWGGQPFFSGARSELKAKNPAMMTLITMGIGVAYIYSLYAFIGNNFLHTAHIMDFFWELASLIVIMLLGHWIEMSATMSAGNALEKMAALLPGEAHVLTPDGQTQDVALADLKQGQTVLIQAGEKIPADGDVISGSSAVNEALVTGESKAVKKENGARVIGGSVNGNGTLTVRVTGTGETGYLAQVGKLVSQAQAEKSRAETMADRVAKWLFYAALSVGIVAFFVWLAVADMNVALNRLVTVLVIACPHALGLAIPLVVARSTSLAATNGLLIRDRRAIESVKQLDTVLMDKTGTLTEGVFKVNAVQSFDDAMSEDQVLTVFAQLEANSSHPLATGILDEAKARQINAPAASDVQTVQGVGLTGKIDGQDYAVVTAKYLRSQNVAFDADGFAQLAAAGNSISYLVSGQHVLGLVAQGDQIKPESAAFISALHQLNIQPVMLTGDNEPAAQAVAAQLGDITVHAELRPEDKEKIVREYQSKGHHVMMVGDGINDAPSLARADIGVAIGAGTDVAIDSADVILVKSNPKDILSFLNLAKATNRKMTENLWWGAGYNIIAIPLAAGVLAGVGFVLSPAVGAIVMSMSTVIVAINAMTLHMRD
ncbi:copper-translocating P-type ATPase [Lacticaseibacillus pabuli]|uniref:P-type Cu(+) transporter n=1 Tax=Lacticaseibacillus pabuli TaxID=3025672 RepID=A0ABY7WTX9_9LACO|nr:copper-translocating P-type ATPase [Lacticaseibacillus sp. KACC 23028]WDF82610.1 copper-translocating P-type ATPase [Lacticaseibacillus sp. KACC 23028]